MKILRIALCAVFPAMVVGACAAGTQSSEAGGPGGTGTGGSLTIASSSSGEGLKDGGKDANDDHEGTDGGKCSTATSLGDLCDDGDPCTTQDHCTSDGTCTGTPKQCPAPDACHTGACDPSNNGECKAVPGNDGAACDDGNPCTQSGTCSNGNCLPGAMTDCSFFDTDCSTGKCDPMMGCVLVPINVGMSCVDGIDAQCATGTCDMNGNCTSMPTNEGMDCTPQNSTNDCISGGTCVMGVCTPEPNPKGTACNDVFPNNSCQAAQCDGMGTCQLVSLNVGDTCDPGSGNPCTTGNCDMNGNCVETALVDGTECDDGLDNPCTPGACVSGTCMPFEAMDGTPCQGSDFCIINQTCLTGVCQGGNVNPCTPPNGDDCHIGSCNEAQQSCTLIAKANGTPCGSSDVCATGETCTLGVCGGGMPANPGASCTPTNKCETGDTCVSGTTTCGNPTGMITTCMSGDGCCPAGCDYTQDADCLYWQTGVQTNVAITALAGWTQCFSDDYSDFSTEMSTILSKCNSGSKLLLACGKKNASSYTVAAMANKTDVLFNTPNPGTVHTANGVAWFFYNAPANGFDTGAWGFAPAGDKVDWDTFFDCDDWDGSENDASKRMCWLNDSGTIYDEFSCGANDPISDPSWVRVIYQAN